MPLQSKLLDYENTQFILIGSDISKVEHDAEKGPGNNKETPLEEMEKLEHEDDLRVEHLKGGSHF
jgi:uroporphyrinogen-III synthase